MAKIGDYELDMQIGAGATGTVWKAHRSGPVSRVVALKRLRAGGDRPGGPDRIQREAAVLAELDHPHILRILDVLDDGDSGGDGIALALQFASGGSLEALLAERAKLPAGEVVAVAAPVAEALASAHRKGILHGDVKPANVLFTSDGEPLLGDFGIARALGAAEQEQVTGSAAYLAPELLDGHAPDPRADVYSLAVLVYRALAGRLPYQGAVPLAVLRAADLGEHPPLSEVAGVPERLADVVEMAMARNPERRFNTADDFAVSLRSSVVPETIELPGTATATAVDLVPLDDATSLTDTYGPRPPRPEPRRSRLLVRLGAAALGCLKPLGRALGRRLQHRPLLSAGLGAALLLVVVGIVLGSMLDDGGDVAPDCPDAAPPNLDSDAQLVSGDTDGDGCLTYGVYELQDLPGGYQEMVLTFTLRGAERYLWIGQAGDRLFLGDWNCDGVDTPGLYRPELGQVQYFDWPDDGQGQAPAATDDDVPVDGTAELITGDDPSGNSCDEIRVA